jgi:hypothetical protein
MVDEPIAGLTALTPTYEALWLYLLRHLKSGPMPPLNAILSADAANYAKRGTLAGKETIPCNVSAAHVHYNGNVYLMKKEDWKEVSTKAINNFKVNLVEARSITYNQLNEVARATEELV